MRLKRIIIAIMLVCMIFGMVPVAAADTKSSLTTLKKQQEQLKKKIELTRQSIKEKKRLKSSMQKDVLALDRKLNEALKALEAIEAKMAELENKITETKRDLERATKESEEQKVLLKKRLRVMYENGNSGMLSVVLNAGSFSDFISRMDYLKKIVNYDTDLLAKLRDNKNLIEQEKLELEEQQNKQAQLKQQIAEKKDVVEDTKQQKEETLNDVSKDLKELEALEDKLLEESAAITKEIMARQTKNPYVGGKFSWPTPGYYTITSQFGNRYHPVLKKKKMHTGIDIGAPKNAEVHAANSGKVIYAGYYGGYGNTVIIDHGGKISTLYAHNTKLLVDEGEVVEKGQLIAKVGSTGLSTGAHCHFEVRENGSPVNPLNYVKGK